MNLNTLLADLEQSAGLEKTASAKTSTSTAPAIKSELASVLEKKAERDLTKLAFDEGSTLAKMLLEKLANEIQIDNGVMEAEDATKVVPVSGGTIEDTLKATVEQAVARGAESDDRVDPIEDNTKQAQLNLTKTAQENKTMAQSIMNKLAQMVGEPTTTPAAGENITPGTVPNMVQMDNAQMTAFDDAKVTPMPGTEGTINNILEALVAKAKAEGAGSGNLVDGQGAVEGAVAIGSPEDQVEKAAAVNALVEEGCDFDTAVSLVKQAEAEMIGEAHEQEKVAAVNALAEAGYDFDTAVELVKQAEMEIAQEEDALEKTAAVNELMDSGYDFDTSVELVKEAVSMASVKESAGAAWNKVKGAYGSSKSAVGEAARKAKDWTGQQAGNLAEDVRGLKSGFYDNGQALSKGQALANIAQNRLFIGGAGLAVGGGTGAYLASGNREKKAALDELMSQGYDFDAAIDLVKQADLMEDAKAKWNSMSEGAKQKWNSFSEFSKKHATFGWDKTKAGATSGWEATKKGAGAAYEHVKAHKGKYAIGAGALAAGGAGYAAYRNHEKKSALEALVAEGIDFDTATQLVKQAELEVYGE